MRLPHVEAVFPKLAAAGYEKTSERTGLPTEPGSYNCIAWAANDARCWWWPVPDAYWPPWSKSREVTVECFVRTFRWLGYRPCKHSRRDPGFEKVVLYAIHRSTAPVTPPSDLRQFGDWIPTHMSRQLKDGAWTSKIGGEEDISHFTLDGLERYGLYAPGVPHYGCPIVYMRRFVLVSWLVRIMQRILWRFERLS